MSTPSTEWGDRNLAHRFTTSFFKSTYGDEPSFITASADRENSELLYFNIADYDMTTEAQICAGQMIVYMENQGLPYESGKTRTDCFSTLAEHLKSGDNKVLATADIIDEYFKFISES